MASLLGISSFPSAALVLGVTAVGVSLIYAQYSKIAMCRRFAAAVSNVDLRGKVVFITGGNTGIGKGSARILVQKGAHVFIACRDAKRADAAVTDILRDATTTEIVGGVIKGGHVEAIHLDLASLKSVRQCAAEFLARGLQIDVLINNAGIGFVPTGILTEDGFEQVYQVNHVGHFLLTNLVLPALRLASAPRIVNVSSLAYRQGHVDLKDLSGTRYAKSLRGRFGVYGTTKLMNVLFTAELHTRFFLHSADSSGPRITANALHPGTVCATDFPRYLGLPPLVISFFVTLFKPWVPSIDQGSMTTVFAASAPALATVSGVFFDKCAESFRCDQAPDANQAADLWDLSALLVKLDTQ